MSEPSSPSEREQLARAAELHRPLARAAKLARANGTGYVVFGALTWLFSLSDTDYAALGIGAVLLVCGVAERRAGARLAAADEGAPRRLAQIEVLLLASIVLYALLKLTLLRENTYERVRAFESVLPPEEARELMEAAITATYGTVLVVAFAYQGFMASYFSRRRADVARYRAEVPDWAREVAERL